METLAEPLNILEAKALIDSLRNKVAVVEVRILGDKLARCRQRRCSTHQLTGYQSWRSRHLGTS